MTFAIDSNLFHFINKTIANPFFDFIMPAITYMGSGDAIFALGLLIILLCSKEKKRSGILILAGLAIMYYAVFFLKDIVARPRPYMVLADVRILAEADNALSFPSGHAARAFMAAIVLSKFFRKSAIWASVAVLVCFSRVYTGMHYVSDVLGGAVLGAFVGWALIKFADYTHIS